MPKVGLHVRVFAHSSFQLLTMVGIGNRTISEYIEARFWTQTTDTQWILFSSKSQTFGLGQTIWADKFSGIGHFSAPILVLWVPCPCFRLFNQYFYCKLFLFIQNPNICLGLGFEFGPRRIRDRVSVVREQTDDWLTDWLVGLFDCSAVAAQSPPWLYNVLCGRVTTARRRMWKQSARGAARRVRRSQWLQCIALQHCSALGAKRNHFH